MGSAGADVRTGRSIAAITASVLVIAGVAFGPGLLDGESAPNREEELDALLLEPLADAGYVATWHTREAVTNCDEAGVPNPEAWVLNGALDVDATPQQVAAVLRPRWAAVRARAGENWWLIQERWSEDIGFTGGIHPDLGRTRITVNDAVDLAHGEPSAAWQRTCDLHDLTPKP